MSDRPEGETSKRLTEIQRAAVRRDVRVGVPLWFVSNCWATTEATCLSIADVSRDEATARSAYRLRALQRGGDLAEIDRAVVAHFARKAAHV